ncbi:hypothetical protein E2C01_080062 [Portunus trituberculatus]|uniref:Uncharacterized protein n=1 Tax=Portunus trituberculatus TaxID=210409 RepID=A0A5B7IN52_PORTR|nr:hypothetical protein [Portunus trituberculatus]
MQFSPFTSHPRGDAGMRWCCGLFLKTLCFCRAPRSPCGRTSSLSTCWDARSCSCARRRESLALSSPGSRTALSSTPTPSSR